jgi:hypothetical protein
MCWLAGALLTWSDAPASTYHGSDNGEEFIDSSSNFERINFDTTCHDNDNGEEFPEYSPKSTQNVALIPPIMGLVRLRLDDRNT